PGDARRDARPQHGVGEPDAAAAGPGTTDRASVRRRRPRAPAPPADSGRSLKPRRRDAACKSPRRPRNIGGMPRIVYVLLSGGGITGGQKMAVRHVETLVDLGFDATLYIGAGSKAPEWLEHHAPMEFAAPPREDDVVVIAEDAAEVLETVAPTARRAVVFSQGADILATRGLETLNRHPGRFPAF